MPTLFSENDLHPGDLLLFTQARGLNRLVTWFTGSPYYHVGLYAGDGHSIEARPQGVVCRDLRRDPGAIFCVIPAPGDEKVAEAALQWARARLGARYDVFDILILVQRRLAPRLRLPYRMLHRLRRNRYECCELVVRAYQAAGCVLFPTRRATDIVPADFARLLPPAACDCRLAEATRNEAEE